MSEQGNTCWTGGGSEARPHSSSGEATTASNSASENDAQQLQSQPQIMTALEQEVQKNSAGGSRPASASVVSAEGGKNSTNKVRYSRIYKKVSSDGNLVLFLPQRELGVSESRVESLMGVALIHENVMKVKDIKVYLQVVLIFRYA